ncbi:MAG: FAD-dependent monooxygenase [Myxococcales bacterium]|nr:FAD-dependent monooxygenase [Myxococcales bacterium]MCB9533231.1 FAD-dependent monooxygenase [Myxococcales bacterium]
MTQPSERVVIAGAGLAGSLLSILFAQRGVASTVYERRPDMRRASIPGGRSINLALSTRGIAALEKVGLAEQVLSLAVDMRGRLMHAADGSLTYQPYGRTGEAIRSVSRRELNVALMDAAERHGVEFVFETRVRDVDVADGTVTLEAADRSRRRQQAPLVVGADGAFSLIRQRMQRRGRFDFEQLYLEHGYKELTMPPAPDGGFRMEPNALHIWPRHDFMMIALPNPDRTFTCTLFLRHEGPNGFEGLQTPAAVEAFFAEHFADAIPHLPELTGEFARNPIGDLATIRCRPFHSGDRVALVGDAAHAVVPFYGQGMNAAFESCVLLDELLAASPGEQAAALRAYSAQRKPDADAIRELALANFLVMRDRVTDERFLQRKQLEHILEQTFGDTYRSLYGLVTFSTTPYAAALQRANEQTAWLDADARSGGLGAAGLLALAHIRLLLRE